MELIEKTDTLTVYGPSGLAPSSLCPIISSPKAISRQLELAPKFPDEDVLTFLNQLVNLAIETPYNPLLLLGQNTPSYLRATFAKDFDLLSGLIELTFQYCKKSEPLKRAIRNLSAKLLRTLLSFAWCRRQHYDKIYDRLSRIMASCSKEGDALNCASHIFSAAKLLLLMSVPDPVRFDEPSSYLYFPPTEGLLSISIPPNAPWPFMKGFTIAMWIRPDGLGSLNPQTPVLLRMRSSTKGFECYVTDGVLYYRILPFAYTKPSPASNGMAIGELAKGKWQFLALSHDKTAGQLSKLFVFLGGEDKQYIVDYPKFPDDASFTENTMFENFTGMASSALVFAHPLPLATVASLSTTFPYGVHDCKGVEQLGKFPCPHKLCAWTAVRATGNSLQNIFCADKEFSASLLGGAGAFHRFAEERYFDPIRNILPMFQICGLLEERKGKKLLCLSLQLAISYLRNQKENALSPLQFQKDCKEFSEVFGLLLLRTNPRIVSEDAVKLIGDVMMIDPLLQRIVLIDTVNFWVNVDLGILPLFWETLKANFACDPKQYGQIVNVGVILRCMVAMDGSLRGAYCCEKHVPGGRYRAGSRKGSLEDPRESFDRQTQYSMGVRYEPMRSLLKFLVINDSHRGSTNIHRIVSILERRPSPCLFWALLSLLKDLCESNPNYSNALEKFDGTTTILKSLRGYPVDLKVIALALTAVVVEQQKGSSLFDIKDFKDNLVSVLSDRSKLASTSLHPSNASLEDSPTPSSKTRPVRRTTSFATPTRTVEHKSSQRKLSIIEERSRSPFSPNMSPDPAWTRQKRRSNSNPMARQAFRSATSEFPLRCSTILPESGTGADLRGLPPVVFTEESPPKPVDLEESKVGLVRGLTARERERRGSELEGERMSADARSSTGSNNNAPQIVTGPAVGRESGKDPEALRADFEVIYVAIVQWLLGGKPEQVLSWKRERLAASLNAEVKPVVASPQVMPVLIGFVKKADSEELVRRYLVDLSVLAECNAGNRQHMLRSNALSKWLILLEGLWYGRLMNSENPATSPFLELLCMTFRLHSTVLCEGLQFSEGVFPMTSAFWLWSHAIQPDRESKSRRRGASMGSIRDAAIVENSWACLKYLWMQILRIVMPLLGSHLSPTIGEQVTMLTDTTLNLIVTQNYRKSQGVRISHAPNPFNKRAGGDSAANPLGQFNVSDMKILESLLDILGVFWRDNGNTLATPASFSRFCKEHALDDVIKLLEMPKKDRGVQMLSKESGFTSFVALIFNIAIRSVVEIDDLIRWLSRAERFCKYLVLLGEYANCSGSSRVVRAEGKNLLLVIGTLLKEFCNVQRAKHEESRGLIARALGDIFEHVIHVADTQRGYMKEFVKKSLLLGHKKCKFLMENIDKYANTTGEEPAKLLETEYKLMFSANASIIHALERASDTSFDIINSDFKRATEGILIRKREAKAQRLKSKLKAKSTGKNSYPGELEEYKQEELEHLMRLDCEFRYWRRQWAKTQKRIKGWQGAWRDRSVFDSGNETKLPLQLATHVFSNGCRCLMKLRCKRTTCIEASQFPKTAEGLPRDEAFFRLLGAVTLQAGPGFDFLSEENTPKNGMLSGLSFAPLRSMRGDYADEVANMLYKELPISLRDLLPTPMDCEIYTPLYAKKGKILIMYQESNSYINFVFASRKPKEDERLMFDFHHDIESKMIKKWKIREIRTIYKKYIVDQRSALELAFYSGKSALFNFAREEDRDVFCSRLLKLRDKLGRNYRFDLIPKGGKGTERTQAMEDWANWKISTFDYLLALNTFSGRSYHNISQYPVFPWVLDDLSSESISLGEKTAYRDLTKNVGMLGDKSRAEDFKSRYELEDVTGLGRFHFGSHYSNPGIVFQYLMRVFPFVEAYIKFFSGLDDPNRMFHSVTESLASAKRDPSDVRELIPEFFTFPDMLINREGFVFGQRDDDQKKVNHVMLPPWAKSSPYTFVATMREALESNIVAATVPRWIDLIFGYQQQGKEAEKACNVFPRLSYDPGKVLVKTAGAQRDAFRMQAYHWGQTPQQLMSKKHSERSAKLGETVYSILDTNAKPNSYTPEMYAARPAEKGGRFGRVIKIITNEDSHKDPCFSLVTIDGTILDITIEFTDPEVSKSKEPRSIAPYFVDSSPKRYQNRYFTEGVMMLDPQIANNFPVACIRRRGTPHIVQGGYINGNILMTQIAKPEKFSTLRCHSCTVTCLEVDRDERVAVSGDCRGNVVVYYIGENMAWSPQTYICDHGDAISYIHISDDMQLFVTASADGTANVYTRSGRPKLLRTFLHPKQLPLQYAILSQNPLPCLVIYSKEDSVIYCFSMNGELISQDNDTTKNVVAVSLGHDSNFTDYLIYVKDKDHILTARKLPSLERRMLAAKKRATTFSLLENERIVIIGDELGNFTMIWDPRSAISSQNRPLLIP